MTEAGRDGKRRKVGLVLEPAGVEDPYSRGAYLGLEQAVQELGVRGRVLTPAPKEGYVPSLSLLARQRYDLVIGVGSFAAQAVDAVATRFADARFAIVDAPHEALEHRPRERAGPRLQRGGSGLSRRVPGRSRCWQLDPGENTISADRRTAGSVGRSASSTATWPVRRAANPDIKTLTSYTDDFLDPAKGRSAAVSQIAKGSRVVFQAASASGLGALEAAASRESGRSAWTSTSPPSAPHVLTSAVKRLDVAVFEAVRSSWTIRSRREALRCSALGDRRCRPRPGQPAGAGRCDLPRRGTGRRDRCRTGGDTDFSAARAPDRSEP